MMKTLSLALLLLGAQQTPQIGHGKGKMYPDFLLPTIDGDTVGRLSDYRGKKVLLFNFASW